MQLSDFDFPLPETLIATRPAKPRSSARLLAADKDEIRDLRVSDLTSLLRKGDRLVLNDTRVIPARLTGHRRRDGAEGSSEAKIEVTLIEFVGDGSWRALLKPLRKIRDGEVIHFAAGLEARLEGRDQGQAQLRFNLSGPEFQNALEAAGTMPLPPYIESRRPADAADREDYQAIWARRPGAVAAPTASLHFDAELFDAVRAMGVGITYVTLHVGAGTFLPVKVDDIDTHKMHSEWGAVSTEAAAEIAATKATGGRVIPVGTTALRIIESAARASGAIAPFEGETDIFIRPGFRFAVTDGLMTNFHLPKSTLLMLVSALMGLTRMQAVYDHAIAGGYRFFSYGDASLLLPQGLEPEPR